MRKGALSSLCPRIRNTNCKDKGNHEPVHVPAGFTTQYHRIGKLSTLVYAHRVYGHTNVGTSRLCKQTPSMPRLKSSLHSKSSTKYPSQDCEHWNSSNVCGLRKSPDALDCRGHRGHPECRLCNWGLAGHMVQGER